MTTVLVLVVVGVGIVSCLIELAWPKNPQGKNLFWAPWMTAVLMAVLVASWGNNWYRLGSGRGICASDLQTGQVYEVGREVTVCGKSAVTLCAIGDGDFKLYAVGLPSPNVRLVQAVRDKGGKKTLIPFSLPQSESRPAAEADTN